LDIRSAEGPGGGLLLVVSAPASALPCVTKRDMEQAWEVAQAGGVAAVGVARIKFVAEPPVELVLEDRDAAAWVAALERRIGLSTAYGVSVCLRLLALVSVMAQAGWARDWFALAHGGAEIRPELLQAAALAPLNEAGGFDETALRALLPAPAGRDAAR
jgi:hypothetical protein